MTRPQAAIAALSVALLIPAGLAAQIASQIEAGALVTSRDGEVPVSSMSVSPAVRVDLPLFAVAARGSAWVTDQQRWQLADGGINVSAFSPAVRGFRAELAGSASRAFYDRSIVDDQVGGQLRLHYAIRDRGGVWVGRGVARPWRIAVVSSVDVSGGGAWAQVGSARVTGTYTNFLFTKILPATRDTASQVSCGTRAEPIPTAGEPMRAALEPAAAGAAAPACRRFSHFSDLEGMVHWSLGMLEVQGQAGYRFGSSYDVTADSRRWSAASAILWLTNRVAAVVGGGRIPANPARGLPARNYANFGLMLARAPLPRSSVPVASRALIRAFETKPAQQSGMQRITVRVGSVESVDIMGDFSDWQPLRLVRRGRDLWELSVPLAPGVHQVNIRVDRGTWIVPPNLPTTRDGFGGETGILVIP